ncbi:macrophage mannose receptor 1-like isoform X1 [Scyliorhinus canicula]|uniref:macrophage mannose receptor 1-like isoform X1 n=1 Tax=Scyliorhinus canicula TaxID=7830 RepID=UPI0018F516EE|nr:macrophage mannose receptor 1-like isoform X1 [Scyliorhinus canicula]XP_038672743.1 macrophage mannose receptor 1-like isoform X1 [Scyliorhinus canicula]
MYRVLMFLLLILAQGQSESTLSEREYYLIQEMRNWTEARDYCQSQYFDLVSVLSPEETAVIANLSAQGDRAWIGLYNDDQSSNGWKWTTGETFNYTNWTPSYPREFNTTSPACVYTNKDQWLDTQCGILLPFICYTVIFQTWLDIGPSEKEYHLIQEMRNWTKARDYCQSQYTDLVSVLSPEETVVIANLSAEGDRTWIGLYNDEQSSNGWKWTTGETFNYTNWTPSYPREFNTTSPACVYTNKDQWLDTQCGILLPFVCYTDMQYFTDTVPVETNRPVYQASSQLGASPFDTISRRNLSPNQPQSVKRGDRAYFLIVNKKSWIKAWNHCRNQYTNLASMRNMEEAKIISSLLHEPCWIGLYNDGLSGWMWTNGDKFTYAKWALWHPYSFSGSLPMCGAILESEWHEADCDFPFAFVCYKELKTKSEPKITKSKQLPKVEHYFPSKKVEEDLTKRSAGRSSSRTYHKVIVEKTWLEARDYCQVHHTDLLSIRNKQENVQTSKIFDQITLGWCGLYNDQQSVTGWKWVNGDRVSYTNWKPGNPYRYKMMTPVCVYIQNGKWSDAPCRFLFPFVCYTDLLRTPKKSVPKLGSDAAPAIDSVLKPHKLPEKNLLSDELLIPKSSSREYFLVTKEETWSDAQDRCRAQYTDLLIVQSKEENNMASKLLKLDEPTWIGLFNEHQADYSWMWTTGEAASFFNWDTYYPMDFATMSVCVIMVNGKWKDVPCDFKFSFICYKDLVNLKKADLDMLVDSALPAIDAEEQSQQNSENRSLSDGILISSRDYFLITKEGTWSDAQDQCRKQHTDLLTMQSKEENNMASKLLKLDEPAWIGLFNEHQADYSWMWTNGEAASFFNWDTYYPMDFATMSVCVIMVNGKWKDVPCDFKFSFICYKDIPPKSIPDMLVDSSLRTNAKEQKQQRSEKSSLSDGTLSSKRSSRQYFLITKEGTWSDAQDRCRKQHTDLLTMQSKEENNMASKLLKLDEPAWIGLFNEHQADYSWMWTNGEAASFFNWDTYYPMDFATMSVCVIVVNGKWKDVPCDFKFSFICYKE